MGKQTYGQRGWQTDGEITDRKRDRQTNGLIDKEIDGQKNRNMVMCTERQKDGLISRRQMDR